MQLLQNPIIPGFAPDPSIVRVGEDYYIATSTFQWWPGVALYHSRDLAHWRFLGHAVTRPSQLNLRGVPDHGGVWAPSLSHADGRFWLIYTNLENTGLGRPFKDIRIFLITAERIEGPWSEPLELNSIGFDPSLFHDEDGRKYLVNIEWDFRKGRPRFAGIVLQELDARAGRLIGPMHKILTKPVLIEGPNLYRKDGWYYLTLAEGGTGWNHSVSVARARSLLGPWELDPKGLLLTSRDDYGQALQKAGHCEWVQTPAGEWYMVHLASRPEGPERRSLLGRETCLQALDWDAEGWPRLRGGGHHPSVCLPQPKGLAYQPQSLEAALDHFDQPRLGPEWSSLRVPLEDCWASLAARPGWLRLTGRQSLHSPCSQSLVARRVRSHAFQAETCVSFQPDHFTQSAGLILHYDLRHHSYLRVTHLEGRGRVVGVVQTDAGVYDELGEAAVELSAWERVYLRARVEALLLRWFVSPDGETWTQVGPVLDVSKLSDEYAAGFTGLMVGLACQDLGGTHRCADFDYFELKAL